MPPDRSSDGIRRRFQPLSAPTWADDVSATAAPTDAATYFGHATADAPRSDATQPAVTQPLFPDGAGEVLATLGALTIDGIDLRADIIRLITLLTTPESPPTPEPGRTGASG